ncbi:hypothetical protein HU200_016196 [Digitaria exilis]|uniref:VQ domain-containing protein n=1 Tax=Digitaria exilis TaxID=1010633 RepID=A0A835KHY9_9POAL|nr:hypothetical protein HU200_016196 [Digitaria exilis]CAB3455741.1 unnamed protein product [Digitaria exilis]
MSATTARTKRPAGIIGLQGPRPQPLSLPSSATARPFKRPRGDDDNGVAGAPGPVIVYEHTPKVIHVRPDEFKALVQRLTGRPHHQQRVEPPATETTTTSSSTSAQEEEAGDTLVLTLGKQEAPALLPSPGGGGLAAADFLFSPSSFLFSPTTMQAIQELIS